MKKRGKAGIKRADLRIILPQLIELQPADYQALVIEYKCSNSNFLLLNDLSKSEKMSLSHRRSAIA